MICPQCNGAVDEQAAACSRCGAPAAPSVQCGLCRAVNRPSNKFCDPCGNPLQRSSDPLAESLKSERKHVTVLFSDKGTGDGLLYDHKKRFSDARDYIARSIDLFDRCGADMLLVEARAALDDLPR